MDIHEETNSPEIPSMRVLVAFEDLRRLYREVFWRAISDLRPTLTVRSASLDELKHVLRRFDPHVVVSSRPSDAQVEGNGAWVQIPTTDDRQLAEVCLGGERWRTDGPPLSELLAVIDEAEERLRDGSLSEAC